MGRINLTPLRVRQRALQTLQADRNRTQPLWLDIIGDIPPAQILTRQQPQAHQPTQLRVRTVPNKSTTESYIANPPTATKPSKRNKKHSRMFAPVQIEYEEDALRKQFFSDHPWELARPRLVVETTGNQYAAADWSRGITQPNLPLSGESVVQRQLWLLQNTPDITVPQAYDIARREFYVLRRQEHIRSKVMREEASHNHAHMAKSVLQWSLELENKQYDDWEAWARSQVADMTQRNAAMGGEPATSPEERVLRTPQNMPVRPGAPPRPAPAGVFGAEAARRSQVMRA